MDDDREFRIWKQKVDREILKIMPVTSDDLPDVDYRANFNSGVEPAEMARITLNEAGLLPYLD